MCRGSLVVTVDFQLRVSGCCGASHHHHRMYKWKRKRILSNIGQNASGVDFLMTVSNQIMTPAWYLPYQRYGILSQHLKSIQRGHIKLLHFSCSLAKFWQDGLQCTTGCCCFIVVHWCNFFIEYLSVTGRGVNRRRVDKKCIGWWKVVQYRRKRRKSFSFHFLSMSRQRDRGAVSSWRCRTAV